MSKPARIPSVILAPKDTRPPGRLMKLRDVERETSLDHATIYRRIAAGAFPRNHPIGGGRKVWLERDIEDWKAQVLANPPS